MPGRENTDSMMTLPPSSAAMRIESSVTVETSELRRMCRLRTAEADRPFERAKST